MKLLADPLEIGMFVGEQRYQQRRKQLVILLKRFENCARGQIQFGQAAAVVFHLFDEMQWSLALSENASGGSGRDLREGRALLRLEGQAPEAAEKLAVDLIGVRLKQYGKAVQMDAELIA